jgi:hypothetical protein
MQEAAGHDAEVKADAYRDELLARLAAIEGRLAARDGEGPGAMPRDREKS